MASGRRLYLGKLSVDAQRSDVEDHFQKAGGKVIDVRINNGYGFIEFDDIRDAEDAVRDLNGRDFMGERLQVEFAKAPRAHDAPRPRAAQPRNTGFRLTISGFGDGTSWQDLKDFARQAGSVTYADVSRDRPDEGVIEYSSARDVDEAFRKLDGTDLNGGRIRLTEQRGGGGGYGGGRRSPSPRRDYDGRDDRRDYDRRDRDYDRRDDRRDSRRGGDDDYGRSERRRSRSPERERARD